MKVVRAFATLYIIARKVRKIALRSLMRSCFRACGNGVVFDPDDEFSYARISLGNDVFIGSGACFGTVTEIRIDDHVMLGPNVTIRGGNHNTALLGKSMSQVKEKRECDDAPVHIETDVWIGAGVTILKGVRISRGAVVGAGSIVTKDVPAYAIVVGNPARVIRYRGSESEIAAHEAVLYAPDDRRTLAESQLPNATNSGD